MIRAGELDKRITLQSSTQAESFSGESVLTWSDWLTVWAKAEPIDSTETSQADETQAVSRMKFTIRYQPGVSSAMRVLYGSRVFGIDGVVNRRERDAELILFCTETT